MEKKELYKLDDDILFRKCSLFSGCSESYGDCTNFQTEVICSKKNYACHQEGLHFHCAKHPEIEYDFSEDGTCLICPKCHSSIDVGSRKALVFRCLKALNRDIFRGANLIRLDDWYYPEVNDKLSPNPNYRIISNVKTDKDGDTIVVLYITYVGTKDKVQYFIKPEKCQLASDHKDMDPAKIISKIEVTLRDRKLIQQFDSE